MHLIADSFTKMGVPFLLPIKKKMYGLKVINHKDGTEPVILLVFVFLVLILSFKTYSIHDISTAIIDFISPIYNLIIYK